MSVVSVISRVVADGSERVTATGDVRAVPGPATLTLPGLAADGLGAPVVVGHSLAAAFSSAFQASAFQTSKLALPKLSGDAEGLVAVEVFGSADAALPSFAADAIGQCVAQGSSDCSLPSLSGDGEGTQCVTGLADVQTPAIAADALGVSANQGQADASLSPLSADGIGGVTYGEVNATLPAITAHGIGELPNSRTGVLDGFLPTLTADGLGSHERVITSGRGGGRPPKPIWEVFPQLRKLLGEGSVSLPLLTCEASGQAFEPSQPAPVQKQGDRARPEYRPVEINVRGVHAPDPIKPADPSAQGQGAVVLPFIRAEARGSYEAFSDEQLAELLVLLKVA